MAPRTPTIISLSLVNSDVFSSANHTHNISSYVSLVFSVNLGWNSRSGDRFRKTELSAGQFGALGGPV